MSFDMSCGDFLMQAMGQPYGHAQTNYSNSHVPKDPDPVEAPEIENGSYSNALVLKNVAETSEPVPPSLENKEATRKTRQRLCMLFLNGMAMPIPFSKESSDDFIDAVDRKKLVQQIVTATCEGEKEQEKKIGTEIFKKITIFTEQLTDIGEENILERQIKKEVLAKRKIKDLKNERKEEFKGTRANDLRTQNNYSQKRHDCSKNQLRRH